jgi:hypothetical protein
MNLVYQANVSVAHPQCALKFRRKKAVKAGPRCLDGNPLVALSIKGLINEAHAPLAYLPENLKSIRDDLSELKWSRLMTMDKGVLHETP